MGGVTHRGLAIGAQHSLRLGWYSACSEHAAQSSVNRTCVGDSSQHLGSSQHPCSVHICVLQQSVQECQPGLSHTGPGGCIELLSAQATSLGWQTTSRRLHNACPCRDRTLHTLHDALSSESGAHMTIMMHPPLLECAWHGVSESARVFGPMQCGPLNIP